MECAKFENKIIAFIEGKLKINENQDFKEHIASCISCHDLVENIRKSYQLSKTDKEMEVSRFFYSNVMKRLENSVSIISFSSIAKKLMIAASVLLFILTSIVAGTQLSSNNNLPKTIIFNELELEPLESFLYGDK